MGNIYIDNKYEWHTFSTVFVLPLATYVKLLAFIHPLAGVSDHALQQPLSRVTCTAVARRCLFCYHVLHILSCLSLSASWSFPFCYAFHNCLNMPSDLKMWPVQRAFSLPDGCHQASINSPQYFRVFYSVCQADLSHSFPTPYYTTFLFLDVSI